MSDRGYGSRREPDDGTWYDRPTQVIAAAILHALGEPPVPPKPEMVRALRHAIGNVDEATWRRAWEIWAPLHDAGNRWTGGHR